MSNQKSTVEDLFSDSGPFDEAAVVDAIRPFITIQKGTNEIFFKDNRPTADQKILIFGLAKKLLTHKKHIDSELITAQEFHKKTGVKKGTIDPAFKKLKETGYLVGKAEYEIPTARIPDVIALIGKAQPKK